jgi:hypothetical protein
MTDTVELIAELQRESDQNDCGPEWAAGRSLLQRTIAALAAQAQEIERLQEIVGKEEEWCDGADLKRRAEAAEARVRELEGIRKRTQDDWPLCLRLALERGGLPAWLREFALMWDGHGHEIHCVRIKEAADALVILEAELAAIEAATIERCAAIVGDHRVAAAIRSLAKEPLTPPLL